VQKLAENRDLSSDVAHEVDRTDYLVTNSSLTSSAGRAAEHETVNHQPQTSDIELTHSPADSSHLSLPNHEASSASPQLVSAFGLSSVVKDVGSCSSPLLRSCRIGSPRMPTLLVMRACSTSIFRSC
jgi:hypothetical protein